MGFQLLVVLLLASAFPYASPTQDYFGDDIDPDNSKHPNSTIKVGSHQKEIILDKYFNHSELQYLLTELGERYKQIVKVVPLGRSAVDHTTIWAVEISRNVQRKRKLLKPMFKFVANLKGDEAVGYAMMVSLIQYLVYSDGNDTRVTSMLDNIDIWIVPTLNPDGFQRSKMGRCSSLDGFEGRNNGNGKYLDQNFPGVQERVNMCSPNAKIPFSWDYQPETRIMSAFIENNPFVLSGNVQGGAVVANYPLDSDPRELLELTGDSRIFHNLAKNYADGNRMMKPGNACNQSFEQGITSGRSWREKPHGMQDFNYLFSNCLEITLYLSCCKYPHSSQLPFYWEANVQSMLKFIESTRQGVYGTVKDIWKQAIPNAFIYVKGPDGISKPIKSTERGEYWILLAPGEYELTAIAQRYKKRTEKILLTPEKRYIKRSLTLKMPVKACLSDEATQDKILDILTGFIGLFLCASFT